jgi:MFS family permease
MQLIHRLQLSFSTHQLRSFFVLVFVFAVSEGILIFHIPLVADVQLGGFLGIGILLAIGNIAGLVTDLLFGFVSEITDHRKFMHLSNILSLLMLPLLLFGNGWVSLVLVAILWGARYELMLSFGANIYLAKHAPHGHFFAISGTSYLVRNLGFFIGPIIANVLRLQASEFIIVALLIIFVVEWLLMYVTFNNHPGEHFRHKMHHLSIYSEFAVLQKHFDKVFPHFMLSFGVAAYEAVFLIFGPAAFSRLSVEFAGLLSGIGLLANVIVPTFMSRIIQVFGLRWTLLISGIGVLFSSIAVWAVNETFLLAIFIFTSFAFLTCIFLINDAVFLHTLSKLKSSEEDEIVSVRSMGPNLGYITASLFGGLFITQFDFKTAVLGCVIILLVTLLIFKLAKLNDSLRTSSEMYS